MPRSIIRIKDWYLVWSTIVDAPIACCQEDGLLQMVDAFFEGVPDFHPERMVVNLGECGTSTRSTVDAIIAYNRAGPSEGTLSKDEIYRAYCLRERIDDWSPCDTEFCNPS